MRWFWNHFLFLCFLIIVAGAIYIALDTYSGLYVARHVQSLNNYSNAGQYLNFVVGIPLAITAALIGTFVSYQIGHFTQTKDDFSILEFVDKVSEPIFAAQSKIALALDSISNSGWLLYETVSQTIGDRLNDKVGDVFWTEVDVICSEKATDLQPCLDELKDAVRAISDQYTVLASQMNSSMFLKTHAERQQRDLPITYLKLAAPVSLSEPVKQFVSTATTRTMIDALIWRAEKTTVFDMLRAYYFMPAGPFSIITYLGLMLYAPDVTLSEPVTLRDGQCITGYTVNIGNAMLVSLYKSLPDKFDMLGAFRELMDIPRVAEKYLTSAGPRMSDLAKQEVQAMMDEVVSSPHNLIVLFNDQGVPLYYDPKEHGDIRTWH